MKGLIPATRFSCPDCRAFVKVDERDKHQCSEQALMIAQRIRG